MATSAIDTLRRKSNEFYEDLFSGLKDSELLYKSLKKGKTLSDSDDFELLELFFKTDVTPFILSFDKGGRNECPALFGVYLLHFGGSTSSSFLERVFSTASQVWNKQSSRLSPDKFEMKSILRHNKKYVMELIENLKQKLAKQSSNSSSSSSAQPAQLFAAPGAVDL